MKKRDLSTLDLPTLQKKKERAATVQKIVLGMILLYLAFIVYFLLTKEWEAQRFGPLVAGLAGLVAATGSLKRQMTRVEEEIARKSSLRS